MSNLRYKPLHEDRFSWYQWLFHCLGISRIVYDPVWERWHIRPNGYNPILYILLVFSAVLMPLFSADTLQGNAKELKDILSGRDPWLWDLYETGDDGQPKYMSRGRVLKEGSPKH